MCSSDLSVVDGRLVPDIGFVQGRPADAGFGAALDEELQRIAQFLGLEA